MEYLPPTSDYVFKRIFGDPNNLYDILADFLKAVIIDLQNYELGKITLRSTHVLPNLQDDSPEGERIAVWPLLCFKCHSQAE